MAIPSRTESGQGVLGIEWPARFSSSGLVTLAPLMLHGGPASDTEVPATLGPRPLIARRAVQQRYSQTPAPPARPGTYGQQTRSLRQGLIVPPVQESPRLGG
jgi:hypothetical protein